MPNRATMLGFDPRPPERRPRRRAHRSPYTIGGQIQRERLRRSMTQRDLADMLGVTQRLVNYWENNKAIPPNRTIRSLIEDGWKITIGPKDQPVDAREGQDWPTLDQLIKLAK